jgi:hypothetical protein
MSVFANAIASCDERIASIQDKLSAWKSYGDIMALAEGCYEEEEAKDIFRKSKYFDKINNYENNIKLIQTEKLLYNALANPKFQREIFPKLLAKYDELMGVSYDLSGNMVITGLHAEGDYLEYCSSSLAQREYIRQLCYYGEKR